MDGRLTREGLAAEPIPTAITAAETTRLLSLARGAVVLELGAHCGYSTVALAGVARHVHSVDWHLGDPHTGEGRDTAPILLANLSRRGIDRRRVSIHIGRIEAILPLFRPGSFGLIFIDALHTAEAVSRDIALASPLLVPGGVFAVHDFGRFGVADGCAALGPPDECTETLAVWRRSS